MQGSGTDGEVCRATGITPRTKGGFLEATNPDGAVERPRRRWGCYRQPNLRRPPRRRVPLQQQRQEGIRAQVAGQIDPLPFSASSRIDHTPQSPANALIPKPPCPAIQCALSLLMCQMNVVFLQDRRAGDASVENVGIKVGSVRPSYRA